MRKQPLKGQELAEKWKRKKKENSVNGAVHESGRRSKSPKENQNTSYMTNNGDAQENPENVSRTAERTSTVSKLALKAAQ